MGPVLGSSVVKFILQRRLENQTSRISWQKRIKSSSNCAVLKNIVSSDPDFLTIVVEEVSLRGHDGVMCGIGDLHITTRYKS